MINDRERREKRFMSKKKVILSTITLLLVMFVAVFAVSYSIANKGHGDKIEQNSLTNLGADASTDYVTNIDLIIENAVKNNETFNVVEIVPSGVEASDLEDYVSSNGFAKYVISANKSTVTEDMPDGMVTYRALSVSSATTLSDVVDATEGLTFQDVLDNADLLYISSPTYSSYNGTNNMTEEVYNYLHYYTSSKPVIMDFVTSSDVGGAASKTMGDLVNAISRNHLKFRTYSWTEGLDPIKFFNSDGSYYIDYGTKDRTATGNILVLANTATPGAGSITKAMQDAGDAAIIKAAYYGMTATLPKKLNYTVLNIGATPLTVADLETAYDFIIIEKDVKAVSITNDVYKKLRGISESSKYILYASSLATKESGNVDTSANNYLKLMQLLISNKGVALKKNVLPISYGFFTSLYEQGADGVAGAKSIADLLNGTVYRNSNTTGAAGKKYRVLEIQPCYPIDLDLAQSNKVKTSKYSEMGVQGITGGYYTYPDQVMYGVTKDEIEEGTEYYAFQISAAKIAYALGVPYDQIEVVSMSANEAMSRKEVISEQYDLVYIGGDSSAYLPYMAVNYAGTDFNWQADRMEAITSGFTSFDMYTHTGNFVDYIDSNNWGLTTNRISGGTNSIEYSGYDISTIKRDELKQYVDMDLPIIVDKVVADAFEESYQYDKDNEKAKNPSRLQQLALHDIDPDCNMYQFLAYAYEASLDAKNANIGWGMIDSTKYNPDNTYDDVKVDKNDELDGMFYEGYTIHEKKVDNSDATYGNTLGSTVTVYRNSVSNDIKLLVDMSAKRPQLGLSSYPKQYREGDKNCVNTGTDVTFTATVKPPSTDTTGQSYTVYLIVDANGDGVYSEGEIKDEQICSGESEVTLSYAIDDDYIGMVNWKVLAVSADGNSCDVQTGNSLFKADPTLKKHIRILQVMPTEDPQPDKMYIRDVKDKHSLYFCTECQMATKVISNNITIDSNATNRVYLESYTDNATVFDSINVGKHEHDFGIPVYNSLTTFDDWEANFADDLTHGDNPETDEVEYSLEYGDYEFEIDILNIGQFEELCSSALSRTEEVSEAADVKASEWLTKYEEGMESANLNALALTLENELLTAANSIRTSGNGGAFASIILEGIGTADAPGQWITDREYYKFWQYFNGNTNGQKSAISNFATLSAAYTAYQTAYDEIIGYYESYRLNSRQAGDASTWLNNNYDVLILGLADEFGNQDMSVAACDQIKTYASNGGSVINTHDTLNAKADGAKVMTNELRELVGMDRFHVLGVADGSTELGINSPTHATKTIVLDVHTNNKGEITIDKRDIVIELDSGNNVVAQQEVGEEKAIGELITITIIGGDQNNPMKYYEKDKGRDAIVNIPWNGTETSFTIEQGATYVGDTCNIGTKNMSGTLDIATGALTITENDTEVTDEGVKVEVTVTNNGADVPDGTPIVFSFRGKNTTVTTVNGLVSTYVDATSIGSATSTPTGVKYRRYVTVDPSKYFWTERLQAASEADYASVIQSKGIDSYVKYNAPVGITDAFASGDASSKPLGPFRYAIVFPERLHQDDLETDGWNYKPHYGTRRATKVNTGGVTMYPFAISDTLIISPTHAQTFALDLEDPSVAVWYTMAPTVVSESPSNGESPVSAQDARLLSSYFAASPRDAMNNYFLYSKDNVFYTGAGHMAVTGRLKDNNDERRLFINVIVNCATKGTAKPGLKLYNKCDEEGSKHVNCDCKYVDPKDDEDNDELAKNLNTLFFNKGIDMYQYNIDEGQTEIYPEFDFKAIAGTAQIKEIQVFYDLDYGTGDGKDTSDTYTNDPDHVLITSYDKSDDMDGVRAKLRESLFEDTLILKEDYFKNYNDYTYIVIRVKDDKNQWKSARVKINIIPYLFDLTDASSNDKKLS